MDENGRDAPMMWTLMRIVVCRSQFGLIANNSSDSLNKGFRLSTPYPSNRWRVLCPMAAGGSDLVIFNVGGKIYTVLREPTLSLHPNSLLT